MVGDKVKFITRCPECGTPLMRNEDEAAHYCPNDKACPPQIKGKIEHFITRKAMNIDKLGTETIDLLYYEGYIRNIADLYDLKIIYRQNDFQKHKKDFGIGEKTTENILKSIESSRIIPYPRVLFALGIRYVGETVAKKLANAFPTIDQLKEATSDDLIHVDEIGERIAQSVIRWFADEDNQQLIERLKIAGLQFELSEEVLSERTDRLAGKSIVISGVFTHHSRDEYKALIEKHGGKNVGSISSKTSFILAGENMGPSKLQKANQLGIAIINEEDFLNIIQGK